MFFGEFTCLIAFKFAILYYRKKNIPDDQMPASVAGNRNYNPLIFFLPSFFDLMATTIMYIGLNMTNASSFQMLRGALIVFTGLLSVAFLNRKLKGYEWLGIFFVITGLCIVGISDMFSGNVKRPVNKMITGDLLIIMAQILTATQMVVEEKFVSSRDVSPLEAVGWEGLFGFLTMFTLLFPFYYINVSSSNPGGRIEDPIDALYQMKNSWAVSTGFLGTVLSISFFNFAGISVTKELSATTRTVLDSIRTFVVWVFSLAVSWEKFSPIQLLGFFVLMIGMFLYNNVLIRPFVLKIMAQRRVPLVNEVTEENRMRSDKREDVPSVWCQCSTSKSCNSCFEGWFLFQNCLQDRVNHWTYLDKISSLKTRLSCLYSTSLALNDFPEVYQP